ncbi:hypothetical protein MC885_001041, partial [Smutsia gigantea]
IPPRRGTPSRLLGLCCAPGLFAGAGARPSCTWAALVQDTSLRAAKRTFPGTAAAWAPWAHPHHTPASPPANPSTPGFSESPREAALRRQGKAFSERELELGHTQSPVISSADPRRERRPTTSCLPSPVSASGGAAAPPHPLRRSLSCRMRGHAPRPPRAVLPALPGRLRALSLRAPLTSSPQPARRGWSARPWTPPGNGPSRPRHGADTKLMLGA